MGTQPVERPVPPPPSATGAVAYAAGRRLLQAGDAQGAAAQFAAAIDADPTNAAYRDASATALWTLGNREAAIAAHAEAARLDPRLQLTYARALDVAGRSAEAAREYEAILQRNPQATTVREDFGRLLFRTGDFGRAAPYLQSAVQQRPDDFVLRQELAYAFDKAGHRDQAVAAYREVLAKAPQAVVSRGLLADNLVAAGHKDEALALLREGLRLNPGLPLLQRQVGAVLEASGQQTAAASAYREYARLAPNAADARELTDRAARLDAQRPQP
jgi:Flp pilus assembly protein TadD